MNKLMFASVISEIEQSDIFMTVKARICEAPAANLNGARVTEAFIDEIVDNEDRYVGLPLYADVRTLINGNYRRLGHLYDSKTGEFHSTQIGSFYQFEKEEFDGGCYLVGYARIAKRNRKLSKAISELFADGNLKFSFEVNVGEYDEMDDGTILIDAAETNYLEGTAIVSFPACKDAVALQLVAQQENTEGGEGEMLKNKKEPTVETAEENVTVNEIASDEAIEAETVVETTAETVENEAETAETVETAETETAETETVEETAETTAETEATTENAEVSVYENHTEIHETEIHDYQNNEHVMQRVTIETHTGHEEEGNLVETDDGMTVAETTVAEGEEPVVEPVEEPAQESEEPAEDVPAPEEQKKTAEQLIAELAETVNALRQEIAELKEPKKVVAEEPKTYNLLMADIKAENKYGLLEKEPRTNSYSLLSK